MSKVIISKKKVISAAPNVLYLNVRMNVKRQHTGASGERRVGIEN